MITNKETKSKRRRVPYLPPDWGRYTRIAEVHGVTRQYVSMVASGQRNNPAILADIDALQTSKRRRAEKVHAAGT